MQKQIGRRSFGGLVMVAAAGLLAACAPKKPKLVASATGVEPVVTVSAVDNRYEPAKVEVKKGDAVRWVFAGMMDHDVVARDGSFVSELQRTGEYVHVFTKSGEFAYDCSVHPEMRGLVVVL